MINSKETNKQKRNATTPLEDEHDYQTPNSPCHVNQISSIATSTKLAQSKWLTSMAKLTRNQ